ncbi:protoporphyrinogen oxidase [Bacillus sp. B15-48]|uniref:protoporphyrinogen oxidase n=1 Tax=Bacillus sp. B15-48 TaxID=1548601 RepID=UPI00193FAB3E|nr:protoporphyrinogen oxidase [Bacillus sp. B15-48]MBM4764178.1 protoporphyrinogen oxidase [Bacillus sp. B15-48]
MIDGKKRVVIVGAGITGLTAAYYLQKHVREHNLPVEVKLIEATNRVGGKLQSVKKEGFMIERGPDSFLERKESAARLAREVGLGDKIINNSAGKSYIFVKEQLHPMPGGSVMGIPAELGPFVTTKLFSWPGKIRAAADFILPPSEAKEDQAVGTFLRRRLGDEVVENLVEPLLSGIYAGDIDRMSLMATFPNFYQLEQKYGSLVRGTKKMKRKVPKQPGAETKAPSKGIFITISSGLQSFAEAIEAKLEPDSVLKGTRVDKISKEEAGYKLKLSNGETWKADSILVTTPHESAIQMFSDYDELFEGFKDIPSTSVATVSMAFPAEVIKKDIDGTGFVVSRNSDKTITACTWTHKKWPHSTPKGKVLLRCYVGRPGDEAIVEQPDNEMIKIVLEDLSKAMDITADPEFTVVSRWKESMPQYIVGHKQRVESVKTSLKSELPGVYIAGSSYEGIGIPDCIDQGEAAVTNILTFLEKQ